MFPFLHLLISLFLSVIMLMYYSFLLLFFFFFFFQSCFSIDTITLKESITDNNILLSRKEIFALGFFSPGNSKFRYLGIWYHKLPEKNVVWVANRNNPISGSSGVFSINLDGNLKLYAYHKPEFPLWSTNVSFGGGSEGSVARVLDSGNLVLMKDEETVWQSFDYPTDTMLPGLKLGLDRRLGLNRVLTSWKSPGDPSTGDWLYKLDPSGSPQYFLSKGSIRFWRSDPWPWDLQLIPGYSAVSVNNQDEIYYTFFVDDESVLTRIVVTYTGLMQRLTWDNGSSQWRESRSEPKYVYGHCGAYSVLNANNFEGLECNCLPGYEPKSLKNWYLRDASAGCVKKRNETMCRNGEGFAKVEHVKLPDTSVSALLNTNSSGKDCKKLCLRNCTCKAFARSDIERKGLGCLTWYGELNDMVEKTEGHDVYIRVNAEELAEYATKRTPFLRKKGTLVILVVTSALVMLFVVLFGYVWMKKKRKTKVKNRGLFSSSMRYEIEGNRQSPDLVVFSLRSISIATNNFDPANKLGEGGFGSVYKGQLDDGKEVAVKRLSRNSSQGEAEFENEVILIAKLQHRNLVKLLGCCVQKEEQMLIYEYLPNKSLDHFIFDEQRKPVLNWQKRFDIIVGIARGILYLHHDSRLRIIHRDLKTSNVLLDADMNPKISDFGMARIFKGEEVQDKTNRVVGTYGYMAPEYVVFGKFSTKSDVFSFGVIMLEIISSKKCSSIFPEGPSVNLISHVWELWKEGRALEIVDPSLTQQSMASSEVSRCIQIGLLCVQENATDRPNMSSVVLMLNGETSLPCPKHPAFLLVAKTGDLNPSLSTPGDANYSVNGLTITKFQAR